MLEIQPTNPIETRHLIVALDEYQSTLYPADSNHLDQIHELQQDHVYFVAAKLDGNLVGCGAIKLLDDYGEIKRMYVSPAARQQGIGKAILAELESRAASQGLHLVRLETGRLQTAAIQLYRSCGYRDVGPFGDYIEDPHSVFMEKRVRSPDASRL